MNGKDVQSVLIICGSARSDGDTAAAVEELARQLTRCRSTTVNLSSVRLRAFDYANPSPVDDFGKVANEMLRHPAIVFATPIYWYAKSGIMKTLFDRFSDLLSSRDPGRRGRRLAGKQAWLLARGTDASLPPGFDVPFAKTAEYLGMEWCGARYLPRGDDGSADILSGLACAIEAELMNKQQKRAAQRTALQ